ncbi:MAG: PKD domain-containing protein, partial [Bacteroidota bacterium]
MKNKFFIFLILCFGIQFNAFCQAPGCPNVDAGTDITIPCGGPSCVDLTATFLETGETTTYTVSSVTFAPPYSFTGGTSIIIGDDDIWSGVITLPFNFCFYGTYYNQLVVGANGVISFDVSLAGAYCEWMFSASIPTTTLPPYPNSINGAYHDIDPSVTWTGAGNDINYAILGTAPCRTFVINYYDIPHFDCNNITTTQQIVLYETTNVIEVYIDDKPTCSTWNSGNAVIGIQNSTGTAGVTPPGRNTGSWTASNEAWRFTPDGTPNYVVEWYEGITQIGTGAIVNVCPFLPTTYTSQVTYTNCDGSIIVETDDVLVTPLFCSCTPIITSTTSPTCAGFCDGMATVSMLSGTPPFTYSWSPSGGSGPTGTGFCSGVTYTISITDSILDACSTIVTLTAASFLTVDITASTNPGCTGGSDGTATVSAVGGVVPYTYSWSPTGGSGSVGTGLSAGITYSVIVTDSLGCTDTDTITLNDPLALTANITSTTNPLCDTSSDGSATVTVNNGTPPYSYTWTPVGGTGATATGLSGDTNYTVTVTDTNGCTITAQVMLTAPAPLLATMSGDDSICTGDSTTLFVIAVSGTAPYTYAWLPSGTGSSNTFSPSFSTTYDVTVTDANGCLTSASYFVGINPPPVVSFTSNKVDGCEPLNVLFSNLTANSANCVWDVGEGGDPINSCEPFTHTYNDAGNYDVTLTVTDVNGCTVSLTDTNYINVYAAPAAGFTAFPWTASTLSSTIIFTDQSLLASYWNWDFSGLDASTLQDPVYIFPDSVPGMYRVRLLVSTSNGCIDSITKTVTIEGAFIFFVPNTFSPNKDGVND